jgi:hypothetical protein
METHIASTTVYWHWDISAQARGADTLRLTHQQDLGRAISLHAVAALAEPL